MAKIAEIDENGWAEWVSSRPPVIQEMCKSLPPGRLYRMKPHGQRVTIISYSENGTVTVSISGTFNAIIFERQVFGVAANSLEECDLPEAGEVLGALLTDRSDIETFCATLRDTGMFKRDEKTIKGSNAEVSGGPLPPLD